MNTVVVAGLAPPAGKPTTFAPVKLTCVLPEKNTLAPVKFVPVPTKCVLLLVKFVLEPENVVLAPVNFVLAPEKVVFELTLIVSDNFAPLTEVLAKNGPCKKRQWIL